jgi:DNA-binding CsgD family transcriptional regulator
LRDLLTVEEAAERLRLSPETVRKLVGMCDRFSE